MEHSIRNLRLFENIFNGIKGFFKEFEAFLNNVGSFEKF
jgi:hypothetical protein